MGIRYLVFALSFVLTIAVPVAAQQMQKVIVATPMKWLLFWQRSFRLTQGMPRSTFNWGSKFLVITGNSLKTVSGGWCSREVRKPWSA